jgi:hypothetical protein
VRDGFGLLVDFLGHEVAVIALVDQQRRGLRKLLLALHDGVLAIADGDAVLGGDHRPIAVLEIGQARGERGQRHGVGAQIHLGRAIADGERRTAARSDQQPSSPLNRKARAKRHLQLLERARHGQLGIGAAIWPVRG